MHDADETPDGWREVEKHMARHAAKFRSMRRRHLFETTAATLVGPCLLCTPIVAYFVTKWVGLSNPSHVGFGALAAVGVFCLASCATIFFVWRGSAAPDG